MRRLALTTAVLLACAGGVTLASPPVASASVETPAKRIVARLVGAVTPTNAGKMTTFIADHLDQVIALKISITPSTVTSHKDQGYLVSAEAEPFSISKSGEGEGADDIEVVVPLAEARLVGDDYVLDGFYRVKSGGKRESGLSFGLEPVDDPGAGVVSVKDVAIAP